MGFPLEYSSLRHLSNSQRENPLVGRHISVGQWEGVEDNATITNEESRVLVLALALTHCVTIAIYEVLLSFTLKEKLA